MAQAPRAPTAEELGATRARPPLEASVKRLIWLSIGLYVIVALVALWTVVLSFKVADTADQGQRDAARASEALCVLRADLRKRVDATRRFLDKHPEGLPGIATRKQLLESVDNQSRTIAALRVLECS